MGKNWKRKRENGREGGGENKFGPIIHPDRGGGEGRARKDCLEKGGSSINAAVFIFFSCRPSQGWRGKKGGGTHKKRTDGGIVCCLSTGSHGRGR